MPGKVTEVQSLAATIEDAFDGDFIIFQSDEEGKKDANSLIKKVMGDVTAASAGRQVAIGGVTGCVAGYLTNKVTRMVGLTLAGTFILFQVANHKGYVKVDWAKLQRTMTRAKANARIEEQKLRQASVPGQIRNFVEQNFLLSTAFAGGFAFGFFF